MNRNSDSFCESQCSQFCCSNNKPSNYRVCVNQSFLFCELPWSFLRIIDLIRFSDSINK